MILLTGATGFLGSFVLDELLNHNYEVMAIFRTKNPMMERYPNVRWIRADLGNAYTLNKLPISSDGIIHLASTLSVQPDIVMKFDIPGIWGLLDRWGDGPFVYISSTDVYGPLQVIPANEDHPLAPSNWYGFGKLVCEQQLQMAARIRKRSDFVIFRPPYILGPHEKFHLSLIGRLITHAMAGRNFILHEGAVNSGHSWVNAYDLAHWIVKTLGNGPGGVYNAVSGYVTWKRLLEIILEMTKGSGRILFQENWDETLGLCVEERHFSNKRLRQIYHIQDTTRLEKILISVIAKIRSS